MFKATSLAAHESIKPQKATLQERVMSAIRTSGPCGMTDEQVQDYLNINPSTQRPRRIELVSAGKVMDSGQKRETKSGRKAVVWVAIANAA